MNPKYLPFILLAIIAASAAGFLATRLPNEAGMLRPGDRTIVARGQAIYAEYCASCHGANLEGQPDWETPKPNGRRPAPPHDLSGHTWHHTDALLVALTTKGAEAVVGMGYQSDMPGFAGTLSDEDIIAVLSFIKSRWPEEVRRRHDELNRQSGQ